MLRTLLALTAGVIASAALCESAHASCAVPPEAGTWINDDADTTSLSRVEVRFVCQDRMLDGEPYPPGAPWYARVYARCERGDCDWADTTARSIGDYLYAVYEQAYARRFLWIRMSRLKPGELWMFVWTDFADPGRRDYTVQGWFHRE
jgi:hypothetical protein